MQRPIGVMIESFRLGVKAGIRKAAEIGAIVFLQGRRVLACRRVARAGVREYGEEGPPWTDLRVCTGLGSRLSLVPEGHPAG